jgi:hypothetical protein
VRRMRCLLHGVAEIGETGPHGEGDALGEGPTNAWACSQGPDRLCLEVLPEPSLQHSP